MSGSNRTNGDVRSTHLDAHEGNPGDFVRRYQTAAHAAAVKGGDAVQPFLDFLAQRIADVRNLRVSWNYGTRYGGAAPGPCGGTWSDYGRSESWDLLQQLSRKLTKGTYLPSAERVVNIPKGSGRGTRPLVIQEIWDRVVHRAVTQILQSLLDPTFSDNSFGGRPGRGPVHALVRAEMFARRQASCVLVTADGRDAFEQINHHRLMDVLRLRLPGKEAFFAMIAAVIGNARGRGLRQGAASSTLLLNLYLDHVLDRVWAKAHPTVPLIRFIDDLLLICGPGDDAQALEQALRRLAQNAGMPLKVASEKPIYNLARGDTASWLGYQIFGAAGEWRVTLAAAGADGWQERLRDSLAVVHSKSDSPLRASKAIRGVIEHAGPAYAYMDRVGFCKQVRSLACEMGFDEVIDRPELLELWKSAHDRWQKLRSGAVPA